MITKMTIVFEELFFDKLFFWSEFVVIIWSAFSFNDNCCLLLLPTSYVYLRTNVFTFSTSELAFLRVSLYLYVSSTLFFILSACHFFLSLHPFYFVYMCCFALSSFLYLSFICLDPSTLLCGYWYLFVSLSSLFLRLFQCGFLTSPPS